MSCPPPRPCPPPPDSHLDIYIATISYFVERASKVDSTSEPAHSYDQAAEKAAMLFGKIVSPLLLLANEGANELSVIRQSAIFDDKDETVATYFKAHPGSVYRVTFADSHKYRQYYELPTH